MVEELVSVVVLNGMHNAINNRVGGHVTLAEDRMSGGEQSYHVDRPVCIWRPEQDKLC